MKVKPVDSLRELPDSLGRIRKAHGSLLEQPTALDSYARWLDAMLAVVMATHDVPRVEIWASVLVPARSAGALRHWCDSVGTSAGSSLKLARSLRAFVRARRTGKDPRRFVSMATKQTADSFWSKVGADSTGQLAGTLEEWLGRQQFVRDQDALEALGAGVRAQCPELNGDVSAAPVSRAGFRPGSRTRK